MSFTCSITLGTRRPYWIWKTFMEYSTPDNDNRNRLSKWTATLQRDRGYGWPRLQQLGSLGVIYPIGILFVKLSIGFLYLRLFDRVLSRTLRFAIYFVIMTCILLYTADAAVQIASEVGCSNILQQITRPFYGGSAKNRFHSDGRSEHCDRFVFAYPSSPYYNSATNAVAEEVWCYSCAQNWNNVTKCTQARPEASHR